MFTAHISISKLEWYDKMLSAASLTDGGHTVLFTLAEQQIYLCSASSKFQLFKLFSNRENLASISQSVSLSKNSLFRSGGHAEFICDDVIALLSFEPHWLKK